MIKRDTSCFSLNILFEPKVERIFQWTSHTCRLDSPVLALSTYLPSYPFLFPSISPSFFKKCTSKQAADFMHFSPDASSCISVASSLFVIFSFQVNLRTMKRRSYGHYLMGSDKCIYLCDRTLLRHITTTPGGFLVPLPSKSSPAPPRGSHCSHFFPLSLDQFCLF